MAEEMRLHLEMLAERHRANGMSEGDARYAARREFGGVEQVKEQCREQRGWAGLEQLMGDFRFAVRRILKAPRIPAVAVGLLALGIGVNTALFSLLEVRMLRPMPVADPDSLMMLSWAPVGGAVPASYDANAGFDGAPSKGGTWVHFPPEIADDFAAERSMLSGVSTTAHLFASSVVIDGLAEFVSEGQLVSGKYFELLSVSAARGRALLPEDDRAGAPPVCVISDAFWRRRFGDTQALGKTIMVNRVPVTIVGVTPPEFCGVLPVGNGPSITLPIALAAQLRRDADRVNNAGAWWVRIIARRQPGVSLEQATVALERLFQSRASEFLPKGERTASPRLFAMPAGRRLSADAMRRELSMVYPIAGMALLVLFAACANVATLLLARGVERRREIATRLALGASRGRIVRQLFVENLLLAIAGAALGVLVARWNVELAGKLFPSSSSDYAGWINPENLRLNGSVLGFAIGLGLVTAVGFGLAPAWRATRIDLIAEFQGGARGGGRALPRLGRVLAALQIVVAGVLLVGAGLFGQSVRNLQTIDLGLNPRHVLMFAIDAVSAGLGPEAFARLPETITERIREVPGVRSATYSGWPVLTGEGGPFSGRVTVAETQRGGGTLWNPIGIGFPETYDIPVVEGRNLTAADVAAEADVAAVNRAFVEQYFPGHESPIGQSLEMEGRTWRIVGVLRNARQTPPELRGRVEPLVLMPFGRNPQRVMRFAVRTDGEPLAMLRAIRHVIAGIAPDAALGGVTTQEEQVGWRFLVERMFAGIASYVSAIALLLASAGLGGLMSHTVARRTNEIGVRMALGAPPEAVLRMILRETLVVVAVGLLGGLPLAAALARLIAGKLYGLTPLDPATYAVVAAGLVLVALAAAWLPARRAARVDPMVALRCE